MLTRRNVLKRFVSTVAAGMALVGLRPAEASPASVKSVEGVVTSISYHSYPDLRYFEFGPHKACMTTGHAVTIIRNGHRQILPAEDVSLGDTMCLPKYLAEPWVRKAMMGHK